MPGQESSTRQSDQLLYNLRYFSQQRKLEIQQHEILTVVSCVINRWPSLRPGCDRPCLFLWRPLTTRPLLKITTKFWVRRCQRCCRCRCWRLRCCCCCNRRQSWTITVIQCTKDNMDYYSLSHDFCSMVTSSTAKPPSFPLPITACMISVMAKLSCFPYKEFVIFLFCGSMHNLPRIGLVPLSRRQTQDCPGWPQIATTFSFWKCPTLLPSIWRGYQCLVLMQRTRNVRRRSRQTS